MKKNNLDPFMVNNFSEIIKETSHATLNNSNIGSDLTGMTFLEKSTSMYMPRVKSGLVLLVTSESIGENSNLGCSLCNSFLESLAEGIELPEYIVFMNTAVKITTNENTINILKKIKKYGTNIIASFESLEYFEISNKCKVASKWSIGEITSILTGAAKIIKI